MNFLKNSPSIRAPKNAKHFLGWFLAKGYGVERRGVVVKKLLSFLFCSFIGIAAFAHTIDWYVDGSIYQTTTCNSGEDITPPTAPAKYGYTFQEWLPYIPIEYLQSTGTQYIDTGIVRTVNSIAHVTFAATRAATPSSSQFIVYGSDTASPSTTRFHISLGSSGKFQMGLGAGLGTAGTIDTAKHVAIINNKTLTITFDNRNIPATSGTYTRSIGTPPTIKLFNANDNIKIYSFKLYDDETLLRDMIPVLDKDGTPCMYDLVEHKYYYNSGTGNFIAGPEI